MGHDVVQRRDAAARRARRRAAGARALPGSLGRREPRVLGRGVRHAAATRCDRRVAEVLDAIGLADRAPRQGRAVQRRHEAPAQLRLRHRPSARACCCSTSRPPASIRRAACACSISSASRRAAGTTRASTRRTTWKRPRTLCDRIAIVDHGKLLAIGTLDELRSARRRERPRAPGGPFRSARPPRARSLALDGVEVLSVPADGRDRSRRAAPRASCRRSSRARLGGRGHPGDDADACRASKACSSSSPAASCASRCASCSSRR